MEPTGFDHHGPDHSGPSRLLSQISQLPQRDGQHRKIEVARGLKVGEHLPAASQCALVLRFPRLDERVRHLHLRAEFQNQAGKLSLQAGDIVSERRFGERLPALLDRLNRERGTSYRRPLSSPV